MKLHVLWFLFCAGVVVSRAASDAPIAFLKGNVELYVTDADGRNPRRLDHDPRGKSTLRWDGYRSRISYLVPREHGESGEMAIIVELDAPGNVVMEAPIPHDDSMRFVEDFEWLPNGRARLGGSVNPRNCMLQDFDPETGAVTNGQVGKCGSFVRSPDDRHTAELGIQPMTDEEHRFDSVDIDSHMFDSLTSRILYAGGGYDVFVPAGPVWSPDSQLVVFLEKRAETGDAGVVFLTLAGAATRVPVPRSVLDRPAIAWVGSKVVAGEGDKAVQIDPATKQVGPVTSDASDEIARRAAVKRESQAARARLDARFRQLGGREGILIGEGATAK
jgi:hypothetical protein